MSQIQVFKYHDSAKNFFPFFFWDILGPKTMQDIWDSKCCPSQNSMQNQGACILPCESPIRLWITVVIIRLLPLMHMKKEFKEGIWHGFSFQILFFKLLLNFINTKKNTVNKHGWKFQNYLIWKDGDWMDRCLCGKISLIFF